MVLLTVEKDPFKHPDTQQIAAFMFSGHTSL